MTAAVSPIPNLPPPDWMADSAEGPQASASPFDGFLEQAVQQVGQLRTDADQKVRGLMTGDGTDIHTALIATQKADLAFDLALAVRNKAVGAYQQLMGIQF